MRLPFPETTRRGRVPFWPLEKAQHSVSWLPCSLSWSLVMPSIFSCSYGPCTLVREASAPILGLFIFLRRLSSSCPRHKSFVRAGFADAAPGSSARRLLPSFNKQAFVLLIRANLPRVSPVVRRSTVRPQTTQVLVPCPSWAGL